MCIRDRANLPYGVFSTAADPAPRVGVRIGDQVLEAARAAAAAGYEAGAVWASADLNAYLCLLYTSRCV